MQGQLEDARALIVRSRAAIQQLGMGTTRTIVELMSGRVETLSEHPQAAERATRVAAEHSAEIVDNWYYVLASIDVAHAVSEQDRPAECLDILDERELHPSPPDWDIIVTRPTTRALALTRLGRLEEAETLAREAVGHPDRTPFLGYHADALIVLAGVPRLAGKPRGSCEHARGGRLPLRSEGKHRLGGQGTSRVQELPVKAPKRSRGPLRLAKPAASHRLASNPRARPARARPTTPGPR
jgi:hypothetical protein